MCSYVSGAGSPATSAPRNRHWRPSVGAAVVADATRARIAAIGTGAMNSGPVAVMAAATDVTAIGMAVVTAAGTARATGSVMVGARHVATNVRPATKRAVMVNPSGRRRRPPQVRGGVRNTAAAAAVTMVRADAGTALQANLKLQDVASPAVRRVRKVHASHSRRARRADQASHATPASCGNRASRCRRHRLLVWPTAQGSKQRRTARG